jgi:hypothetical protein
MPRHHQLEGEMTSARFFAALGAVCLAAAAAGQSLPVPADISSRLTANDLRADVSFLASDTLQGRGTPSPGLDVAAEFIASEFRRAGLDPAGDDGYFQTALFESVTPNFEGLELTVETGGQTLRAGKGTIGFIEAAATDLSHAAAVKAPLEASALDALGPEQVRGKVLIVDASTGGFPLLRRIPALAAKLHPAAVILLRPAGQGSNANARLREASATPVPILVVWDSSIRIALAAAAPGSLAGAVSLHVAAPGVVPVRLKNVVGVLPGSNPILKQSCVLVTAHYDHLGVRGTGPGDHIYNGANDDASGTASVIEIAKTLAALPARPKRSTVFIALFGEELGLVGSRYYARHPIFPLALTVADLNLEQMGRTDDVTGPRVGLVNATGFDFTSLTGDLKKAGEAFGIAVVKDEESSDAFFARSDNQAFADAGIPSHTLSVGYVFPDYHKPGDEWPKIDYENMAKVDRAVALMVYRVADADKDPQWNASDPKTERYVKAHEALVHATK